MRRVHLVRGGGWGGGITSTGRCAATRPAASGRRPRALREIRARQGTAPACRIVVPCSALLHAPAPARRPCSLTGEQPRACRRRPRIHRRALPRKERRSWAQAEPVQGTCLSPFRRSWPRPTSAPGQPRSTPETLGARPQSNARSRGRQSLPRASCASPPATTTRRQSAVRDCASAYC